MERVVVVGGGILGMMHAVAARRRGCQVIQLEREAAARGASVRNFGLIWVSGRAPGAELDLALRARTRWAELAEQVPGIGLRPHGSLTLAADAAELRLIEQAAAMPDAVARGYQLLSPPETRELNPALAGDYAGALWCRSDAIVEPRRASAALREYLLAGPGYTWLPGRAVVQVGPRAVRDHTGEWHGGDLVVLCTGATHACVAGQHLAGLDPAPLRRVRLQMLQTEPFAGRLTTSVADGDSLRYYPAYDLPARALLAPQAPAAAAAGAQLLLVQRLDGSLTIGDTHAYDEPFGFDVDEAAYDHLLQRAGRLLGTAPPPARLRWAGVYSQLTGPGLYHRSAAAPGVVLVTGAGGRGMTCAPAIADDTFAGPAPAAAAGQASGAEGGSTG
jgi:FAD dependent oxidoreductase TIGR03364